MIREEFLNQEVENEGHVGVRNDLLRMYVRAQTPKQEFGTVSHWSCYSEWDVPVPTLCSLITAKWKKSLC